MAFGGNIITQIKQMSGRLFERLLSENGVCAFNSAQAHILHTLWEQDGISVHEISQRTGLAMASLSGMLDRMEKGNLIERYRDEVDRRKVLVYLTDEAKALQPDFIRVQKKMKAIYYSDFTAAEIKEFENALQRILQNVTDALQSTE